jgi:hypothetical protein
MKIAMQKLILLHSLLIVGSLAMLSVPALSKTDADTAEPVDSSCSGRFIDPFKCPTGPKPSPCEGRFIDPFKCSNPPAPAPSPSPGTSSGTTK